MNEEPLTDDQLHLATSRNLPPGGALEGETAALRERFLALGTALEQAGAQFDETAFVQRLKNSLIVEQPEACCLRPNSLRPSAALATRPSPRWPRIFLAGALAAAALLVIFSIVSKPQPASQTVHALPQHQPPLAAPSGDVPRSASDRDDQATLAQADLESTIADERAAWTDPLDDEIASAQAEIERLVSRNLGLDGSLLFMNDGLESLSRELEGESL